MKIVVDVATKIDFEAAAEIDFKGAVEIDVAIAPHPLFVVASRNEGVDTAACVLASVARISIPAFSTGRCKSQYSSSL